MNIEEQLKMALEDADKKNKSREIHNLNVFKKIIREIELDYIVEINRLTSDRAFWRFLRYFKLLPGKWKKEYMVKEPADELTNREQKRYWDIIESLGIGYVYWNEKRPTDVGLNNKLLIEDCKKILTQESIFEQMDPEGVVIMDEETKPNETEEVPGVTPEEETESTVSEAVTEESGKDD